MNRAFAHAAVALVAGIAAAGCARPVATAASPRAADWRQVPLVDLESRPVALGAMLAGHPALVNLWAPWCPRCTTELPDLQRLSAEVGRCALVVGVAVGEQPVPTAAFVRARGLGYPQIVDERFRLADALGQSHIPATLVIDAAGTIVHTGPALDQAAVSALRGAVAEATASGRCSPGATPPAATASLPSGHT